MSTAEKPRLSYPIHDILTDIAHMKGVELNYFTNGLFNPNLHGSSYPYITDLLGKTSRPIDATREDRVLFEGSNDDLILAYVGQNPMQLGFKEEGLLKSHGRRIHVQLGTDGRGNLIVKDNLFSEAVEKLGSECDSASFFSYSAQSCCFLQRHENHSLPGVRSMLYHLVGIDE